MTTQLTAGVRVWHDAHRADADYTAITTGHCRMAAHTRCDGCACPCHATVDDAPPVTNAADDLDSEEQEGRPCRDCGKPVERRGERGRYPVRCPRCRARVLAEKQRAYYEQNRAEIAEKQRAYYEQNRAEIAEKKRAYRDAKTGRVPACARCGRPHERRRTPGRYPRLCADCKTQSAGEAAA